jgi:hypothetical protein
MPTKKRHSRVGWYEEYRCGCVSETVRRKRDLLGYCPKHGEDRRAVHADLSGDSQTSKNLGEVRRLRSTGFGSCAEPYCAFSEDSSGA